jgi:polyhydroxyalkanoate synthesis regulator phasin
MSTNLGAPELYQSAKMNLVLKKLKVKFSWETIMTEYEKYEEFDQEFFDSKPVKIILKQYQDVFYFGAVNTDKAMLNNLKKWMNKYWSDFRAETIEEVHHLMQNAVNTWNELKPEEPKIFVNELPKYGGKSATELKEKQAATIAKLMGEKPPKAK